MSFILNEKATGRQTTVNGMFVGREFWSAKLLSQSLVGCFSFKRKVTGLQTRVFTSMINVMCGLRKDNPHYLLIGLYGRYLLAGCYLKRRGSLSHIVGLISFPLILQMYPLGFVLSWFCFSPSSLFSCITERFESFLFMEKGTLAGYKNKCKMHKHFRSYSLEVVALCVEYIIKKYHRTTNLCE